MLSASLNKTFLLLNKKPFLSFAIVWLPGFDPAAAAGAQEAGGGGEPRGEGRGEHGVAHQFQRLAQHGGP